MRAAMLTVVMFLGCAWTNTSLHKAPPPKTPEQQQAAAEAEARQRAMLGQVLNDAADIQRDASYQRQAIYYRQPAPVIVVPDRPPPPRPVQVQCVDLGAGVVQCNGN